MLHDTEAYLDLLLFHNEDMQLTAEVHLTKLYSTLQVFMKIQYNNQLSSWPRG